MTFPGCLFYELTLWKLTVMPQGKKYTHFDDAFRQRMARVQGLFSQEDAPNGPKFPDFPSKGRVM